MTTLSHSVEATVNVPHILPHKGRLCSICKLMFVLSLWAGEPLTQSVCVWRPGTQNNRLCFSRIPTAQKYTLHTPPHTCCNVWVYALRKLTWKNVHLSLFLGLNFRHHTLIVRHNIQSVPPKSLWERMSGPWISAIQVWNNIINIYPIYKNHPHKQLHPPLMDNSLTCEDGACAPIRTFTIWLKKKKEKKNLTPACLTQSYDDIEEEQKKQARERLR